MLFRPMPRMRNKAGGAVQGSAVYLRENTARDHCGVVTKRKIYKPRPIPSS